MMRLRSLMMLLLLSCLISQALADETQLRKLLEDHFPGTEIESLRKTPFAGLYEVVVGGEVLYTDDQAKYFFMGHMIDTQSRVSLTSERMQQIRDARRIPIDTLPLEHSIKVVKGKGERTLIVYSDPNCPFCKKLEKELVDIKNITVHTLLYPILNGSMPTATSIWCASDRLKASSMLKFSSDSLPSSLRTKIAGCSARAPKLRRVCTPSSDAATGLSAG